MAALDDQRDRLLDRRGRAADHELVGGIDVREDDVAVDLGQHPLDLVDRRRHGGHRPVVLDAQVRHLAPAGAHGLERVRERQHAGGDERAVLAQRVAHDEVGLDAVGGEQARQRDVDGQHGGLRDLGAHQLRLGLGHAVVADEDDVRQRAPAEQRSHDRVGLVERRGDDRLRAPQLGEHVRVLRALAGVEERDLAGRAAAAEDPAALQRLPRRRVARLDRLQRGAGLGGQFAGVGVVDADPLGRGEVLGRRGSGAGASPGSATARSRAARPASSAAPTRRAPRDARGRTRRRAG